LVTAFFFLFAIPIPPLRFSAARRPPSSMNEQPLATTSILFLSDRRFSCYLAFKNISTLQQTCGLRFKDRRRHSHLLGSMPC
jgi:hypothetical protein